MYKKILVVFLALVWLFFTGCATDENAIYREVAEDFVTAIADGDEDAVWESFTPVDRTNLIDILGKGDEDTARKELLKIFQDGIKKRFALNAPEDLLDNDDLFEKAVNEVMADKEKKFRKIGDDCFLVLNIDEIGK